FFGEYVFFLLFYLVTKSQTDLNVFYYEPYRGVAVDAFSALGILMASWLWILLLGLFQLLIVTDLVAHDLAARVHELVMSTPTPTWAYIWGRYLAGVCIGLAMSLVLLVAVPLVGYAMHAGLPLGQYQDVPGYAQLGYPAPNIGVIVGVWALFVLPTILLLTALGFVVGTLLPKYGNVLKLLLCAGWAAYMFFGTKVFELSSVTANWELTTGALQGVLVKQAQTLYHSNVNGGTSMLQRVHIVRSIEQQVPDMLPWILPHLLYAGIALLCVYYLARSFQRFAGVTNGELPAATTCSIM
ncbi:MAG TPA: hypothetical protein VGU68_03905, partial [Ktedonobacteraceae bacterium]|nr:hypothetical protein [Ktedonobacteraceae bacterium]